MLDILTFSRFCRAVLPNGFPYKTKQANTLRDYGRTWQGIGNYRGLVRMGGMY